MRRTDEIPDAVREKIRTDIAREQFAATFDRAPLDERELSAFITRETRQNPASVAGFDLTFSAPKSFTILWAAATPEQRAQLQQVHDDAVADALKWVEENATFRASARSSEMSRVRLPPASAIRSSSADTGTAALAAAISSRL